MVLALALAGAGTGLWLEREVESLRAQRYEISDQVLNGQAPLNAADPARTKFGTWHAYSLLANFGTLTLVTVAMGMAAVLPEKREP